MKSVQFLLNFLLFEKLQRFSPSIYRRQNHLCTSALVAWSQIFFPIGFVKVQVTKIKL